MTISLDTPLKGIPDHAVWEAVDEAFYDGRDRLMFNGYRFAGYVGSSQRNYATDLWVLSAARELDWTLAHFLEFVASKDGRWTLDQEPLSAVEVKAIWERNRTDASVRAHVAAGDTAVAR